MKNKVKIGDLTQRQADKATRLMLAIGPKRKGELTSEYIRRLYRAQFRETVVKP